MIDLLLLAKARLAVQKQAAASPLLSKPPTLAPPIAPLYTSPLRPPPLRPPTPPPIRPPATPPPLPAPTPAPAPAPANPLGGLFNHLGGQSPEGLAGMLANPMFRPISHAVLGTTGAPGLAFMASHFGQDAGQSWRTLTQGNPLFPKQALEQPAQPLTVSLESGKPPPSNFVQKFENWLTPPITRLDDATGGRLSTAWHGGMNPEPGRALSPLESLRYNTGHIGATLAGAYAGERALDRGLFGRADLPRTGGFLGRETSRDVINRWTGATRRGTAATRFAPIATGTSRVGGGIARAVAPRAIGLTGGPLGPVINAGIEGIDILRHGYNVDEHRRHVTPDGTIMGVPAHPALDYGASAFNAWSNPIRSTDLLIRDTPGIIGLNPRDRDHSLPHQLTRRAELVRQHEGIAAQNLEALQQKVRTYGMESLTSGERIDLATWQASKRQNRGVLDLFR